MSLAISVAIVGSRDYPNLDSVRAFVGTLSKDVTVVSGDGLGVDRVAVFAAKSRSLKTLVFPPERNKGRQEFIKSAFARNQQIVDNADIVVAFMKIGGSRGTLNTIERAEKAGKVVIVFTPEMGSTLLFP